MQNTNSQPLGGLVAAQRHHHQETDQGEISTLLIYKPFPLGHNQHAAFPDTNLQFEI